MNDLVKQMRKIGPLTGEPEDDKNNMTIQTYLSLWNHNKTPSELTKDEIIDMYPEKDSIPEFKKEILDKIDNLRQPDIREGDTKLLHIYCDKGHPNFSEQNRDATFSYIFFNLNSQDYMVRGSGGHLRLTLNYKTTAEREEARGIYEAFKSTGNPHLKGTSRFIGMRSMR